MNFKKYIRGNDSSIKIKNSTVVNSFNKTIKIDIKNIKKWWSKTFQKEKYYNEIFSILDNQLSRKIKVQKQNRKYIPEVFLELNDIKEKLRYVTKPISFYKKDIEELKGIEFNFFNEVLEELNFEKKQLLIKDTLMNPKSIHEMYKCLDSLKKILKEFKNSIPNLVDDIENIKDNISSEKHEFLLKNQIITRRFEWFIDNFEEKFNLLDKQLIFLTEKAGQGKTNLICDFVDNVMIKKKLLGVMFTGNEFNNLDQQQIEDAILKDIYLFQSTDITFDEFLEDIEYLCNKNNSIFTILIDGLNENSNIEKFSQELYKFVEKILSKNFIRLIFTCRSEYFEQRFKIFKVTSFNKKMLMIDNYMGKNNISSEPLPEYLQDRLLERYNKFFKVESAIFDNVREKLSDDFLLLRIFCEVYGKLTNPNAPIEQVYDIYKDDLFKKYFEYKKDEIVAKKEYSLTDFQQIFKVILTHMVNKSQYVNIPFDLLTDINHKLLNHIIDEDIFFRKDIIKDEASVFANKEVLNFTFDEFRDYLLADFLSTEVTEIEEFIKSVTTDVTSIEGIKKYLFFKSRKPDYRKKLKFLESLVNYDELFLDNIFSVKDEDIVYEDIQKIKYIFTLKYDYSKIIIYFLMFRHRTKRYRNLNIFTLFEIITSLNDEQYSELVNQKFKIKYNHYSDSRNSHFIDLLKHLDEIIDEKNFSEEYQLHNFFEFMFLLLGVDDEEYFTCPYELIDLLEKYINKYPKEAKKVLLKYKDIQITKVKKNIWKLLNFYADKQQDFDISFYQEVFYQMLEIEDLLLKNQYQFFLEKCYNTNIDSFNGEQKEYFENLKKEKEANRIYLMDRFNEEIYFELLSKDIENDNFSE